MSAVEALARSLVVHSSGRPSSTAEMRYRQFRTVTDLELVQEVLRLRGATAPAGHFGRETWADFELARELRDLIVHECTGLESDRYARPIAAAEAVLEGLVELCGLPRPVR
jgi:hypothetical protein